MNTEPTVPKGFIVFLLFVWFLLLFLITFLFFTFTRAAAPSEVDRANIISLVQSLQIAPYVHIPLSRHGQTRYSVDEYVGSSGIGYVINIYQNEQLYERLNFGSETFREKEPAPEFINSTSTPI